MKRLLAYALVLFFGAACSKKPDGENFITLSEKTCVPFSAASTKPVLPAQWQPYLSSTRICPLSRSGGKVSIVLVSVFIDDFYRDRPMDAEWGNFPKPIFFDANGRCVARLSDLYPTEPPRDLEISYGRWQDTIPGEIRTHVSNPAVGGDFELPVLSWDPAKRLYVTVGESSGNKKERMGCNSI